SADLEDVALLCGIHMKRSMHEQVCSALGVPLDRAVYLDDTGHMSGVDPLFGLDRAAREGRLEPGDLVLLLAAGTGYPWAAACIRGGGREPPCRSRHRPSRPPGCGPSSARRASRESRWSCCSTATCP